MIAARECAPLALREALRRQPLSDAKVRFAWMTAVGPRLGRATTVRLTPDGTLLVRAADPHWRLETLRSEPIVRRRLSQLLGGDVVSAIVVSVEGASHA